MIELAQKNDMSVFDAKFPAGPLAEKWDRHRADIKLVSPKNKRKFHVIIVGSGLAGASAAATMSELGYQVSCFCFHSCFVAVRSRT